MGLADPGAGAGDLGWPLVHRPVRMFADEGHIGRTETRLLGELSPGCRQRTLVALQPALWELPLARDIHAFERQHVTVGASDHDDDPSPEVATAHGGTLLAGGRRVRPDVVPWRLHAGSMTAARDSPHRCAIAPTTVISVPDPLRIAKDTFLVRPLARPLGSSTGIHLSSLVILGREPVLVDTSAALAGDLWREQVFALVEPEDVRWIFLSHDHHDHIGNLPDVMERCPNATVVTSWLGDRRMAGHLDIAPDRQHWINDGEQFDIGDRHLVAVRPPVFDSPETRGVYDPATGVYWASDAFGTPVTDTVDHVGDLPADVWAECSDRFALLLSPWLAIAAPEPFGRWVDRVAALSPHVIVGAHGPMISGPAISTALARLRGLPGSEQPVCPGQPALEEVIELLAAP